MYGIYDLSGGLWERTSSYVANGNNRLKNYGLSYTWDGSNYITESSKYAKVYSHDSAKDNVNLSSDVMAEAEEANYTKNSHVYGDAIYETSTAGTGNTSWYEDGSTFIAMAGPFMRRSGAFTGYTTPGLFYFSTDNGGANYGSGFRAVVIVE